MSLVFDSSTRLRSLSGEATPALLEGLDGDLRAAAQAEGVVLLGL